MVGALPSKYIDTKSLHCENACDPILPTPDGIVRVNLAHPLKAPSPIMVILDGRVKFSNPLQYEKA